GPRRRPEPRELHAGRIEGPGAGCRKRQPSGKPAAIRPRGLAICWADPLASIPVSPGWAEGRSFTGEGAARAVLGARRTPHVRRSGTMSHPARAGALLRTLRQAHGSTQSDLGRDSGVSVRTIRGLERGEIQRPQLATLQQL